MRSSIVGWLVTVICQTTSAQVQPPDAASLQAFYQEWMGAAAQQGPAAYASYYAVNGQILPPNAAPVVGREAIADWLERSQAETAYSVRPEGIHVDEVRFLDRNWAIYRSTLRGQRVPKAGGEPSPFETKYFDVLHRPDNGRWEVVYRMWSDNLR